MAVTISTTRQAGPESSFEAERTKIITNINQELGQVISNINILNRNLETIITIGQEFDQLSHLWKRFHASGQQLAEDEPYQGFEGEQEN